MAREVHIQKGSTGGWTVSRHGAHEASVHKTQAEAVAAARRLALKSGGAEVVVHRADGRIRDSTSVGAAQIDALKREGRLEASKGVRAPRTDGPRTTLRVPSTLVRIADQLARELGISRNDALLRLATRGARLYEQEQQIAERREARWAAVIPGIVDIEDGEFPSPQEAHAAVASTREEAAEAAP
jgi:hypothetical protein